MFCAMANVQLAEFKAFFLLVISAESTGGRMDASAPRRAALQKTDAHIRGRQETQRRRRAQR